MDCDGLTPGDFAVVAQRARLLGEARAGVLRDWLLAERDARGPGRGVIGFHGGSGVQIRHDRS